MSDNKFSKPPLASTPEQQKKLDAFLEEPIKRSVKKEAKKPTKGLFFRVPVSMWEELQELIELTGVPVGALCIELLRPQIKAKLREVKNE